MRISRALLIVSILTLCTAAADPPAELRLEEIFGPVGPRGLEFSAKTRGLEGRRVRIAGYRVHRDESETGSFLLAPFPVQLHDQEYGLADDLPPSTVLVEGSCLTGRTLPHSSRLLTLTGVLRLGPREEPDGRISFVRLVIDELPNDLSVP